VSSRPHCPSDTSNDFVHYRIKAFIACLVLLPSDNVCMLNPAVPPSPNDGSYSPLRQTQAAYSTL